MLCVQRASATLCRNWGKLARQTLGANQWMALCGCKVSEFCSMQKAKWVGEQLNWESELLSKMSFCSHFQSRCAFK
jgi:hypothetical protein